MNPPAPTTATGRRPRLLVIASTFPGRRGDGTPPFVRNLAEYESRYFETLVVVPRVPGSEREEVIGSGTVRRFRYFPRRWEDLAHGAILENVRARPSRALQVPALFVAELLAVRRAMRRFRPDVVHVHWIVPQGIVALLACRSRPWLLTTLGGDVYALGGRLWSRLNGRVVRQATALTTMNADMAARLVALGAEPSRVQVLPMGADLTRVRAAAAGIERIPGRVLVAGRLVEKKGVGHLLEALARLPGHLDWSLDVVGDGPLRAELERRAAPLGGRVRFRGQLGADDLSRAMAEASVVVVPSVPAASGDQDGLPVVLLEAMGAGCAIVGSRLPGLDEALTDGESGVLVPPGDPQALAEALGGLLADPVQRAALGAAASRVADGYSAEAVGSAYVELLRKVAAGAHLRVAGPP